MCLPVLVLPVIPSPPSITSAELQIGIVISAGLILLFALVAWFRRRAKFRGYEDIVPDVCEISRALRGKVYRKHDKLRVQGQYQERTVWVTLSRTPNTPGLHIRFPVDTPLTLFLVPRKFQDKARGRVLVQTPDPMFDSRFATRSDQPGEIRLLVSSAAVQRQIQQLCCSPSTCIAMSSGVLEMVEPLIPEDDLYRHVVNHVKSVAKIGAAVLKISQLDQAHVAADKTKSHRLLWTVTAIATVVLMGLFLLSRVARPAVSNRPSIVPAGILTDDAAQIPNVDHWRLAGSEDFDSECVAWMESKGRKPAGHILGKFSGEGFPEESAYVLVSDDGRQPRAIRIVVFVGQTLRFDRTYPSVAAIATVPRPDLINVSWKGTPPLMPPDGDGVLIVPKYQELGSASIIFVSGKQVLTSGAPVDFRTVSIR